MSITEQLTDEQCRTLQEALGCGPDDLEAALENYVADEYGVTAEDVAADMVAEPDAPRRFSIPECAGDDPVAAMQLANWARAKWLRAQEKLAEVDAIADAQIAAANQWREQQRKRHEQTATFFSYLLREYAEAFHSDETSVALSGGGRIRWRKQRSRLEWNEELALQYAQQHNIAEALRISIAKTPLKARLQAVGNQFADAETGEVVPFLVSVPPDVERELEVE